MEFVDEIARTPVTRGHSLQTGARLLQQMVMREGTWADEYHLIVRTRAAQQAHARTLYERLGFHAGIRTDKRSQLFESGAGRQYLRVDAARLKANLQAVINSTHGGNAHGWTCGDTRPRAEDCRETCGTGYGHYTS